MPRSAFTAFVEQHLFLILLDSTGEISGGIRQAIERLVKLDEESAQLLRQARWLSERAKTFLNEEATQKEVLDYAKDNLPALMADWERENP